MVDFSQRIKQLQGIAKSKDYGRSDLWLGGLFYPEAYFTATRQSAAQAHQWSIENLELQVEVLETGKSAETDDSSFIVRDILLEGAAWTREGLQLTNDISVPLPSVKFEWKHREKEHKEQKENSISLPIYLNETRFEFLVAVDLRKPSNIGSSVWYQRGVALSVWHVNM